MRKAPFTRATKVRLGLRKDTVSFNFMTGGIMKGSGKMMPCRVMDNFTMQMERWHIRDFGCRVVSAEMVKFSMINPKNSANPLILGILPQSKING
jgi:hypothetical protein